MKNPTRQVIIGILVILCICLLGCAGLWYLVVSNSSAIANWAGSQVGLQIGTPAPDFELPSLSGDSIRLSQYQGTPVLLSFGATWCPPCREEAPLIQRLHEAHPELVVLLVDMDDPHEDVQEFADRYGLTHPVLLDENSAVGGHQYHVSAIPTSFFIDSGGILRAIVTGCLTPEMLADKLRLIGIDS